jgi:chaperonin GroES
MELKDVKLDLEALQDSKNINDMLDEDVSDEIGRQVHQGYQTDLDSRQRWEDKMRAATELALQLVQPKTYPWPKSSNVKFPLLTIASLQFAARAYPALVKAPDLVKYRVQGEDPNGEKSSRASRIQSHLSYQLLEEDEQWEEDQDKAFLALPILGCVFKKSYYDPVEEINCSRLVLPKDLVVHYYARTIEKCERKTEVFELYPREIKERQLRGVYTEVDDLPAPSAPEPEDADKRQGTTPPYGDTDEDRPRTLLESHCYLDLDGDGYKEPYVVTVDKDTEKVFRIVARFKEVVTEQAVKIDTIQKKIRALAEGLQGAANKPNHTSDDVIQARRVESTINLLQAEIESVAKETPKVLSIKPIEYYTKYSFIPSPDGGFYDLGFGALLGPLNDSVNTIINQLIDAGTLQNSNSGFLGKGARIKGGRVRFMPNEWKRVDVAGGTLKDAIVPLPVNEPSATLFNLLSLLISYSERVGSVTDTMVGENPGQNTPAYNYQSMLEQGLQIFNGIFKRVYRSFRSEVRKVYELNSLYLDQEVYFEYQDSSNPISRVDYHGDPKDLIPAADPNAFSNKEKVDKAVLLKQAAMSTPGYDPIKVEQRWLEAFDVPDSNEIFPLVQGENGEMQLKFPPGPDPEFEIKKAEEERKTLESKSRSDRELIELESKLMVNEAQVLKLMADAAKSADEPDRKRLELKLREMESLREHARGLEEIEVEREKIDATKEIARQRPATNGVGRTSGN